MKKFVKVRAKVQDIPDKFHMDVSEIKSGTIIYVKDLQFDKVTDDLIHADFLELVEDKKVIATIPLKFTGAAKGVKDGGKLITKMKALKVKTLPKFLKENIEVAAVLIVAFSLIPIMIEVFKHRREMEDEVAAQP